MLNYAPHSDMVRSFNKQSERKYYPIRFDKLTNKWLYIDTEFDTHNTALLSLKNK